MKYKLERHDFGIFTKDIYLFPTIRIITDNHCYLDKNISIEFHFLMVHCRLLWLKEK